MVWTAALHDKHVQFCSPHGLVALPALGHSVTSRSNSADAGGLQSTSPDHEIQLLLCNVHGLLDKVCFSDWYQSSAPQGQT